MRERGSREKSGQRVKVEEEERKRERARTGGEEEKVEKQDAALKVDGVSCYVLLSTLGRSPYLLPFLQLMGGGVLPFSSGKKGKRARDEKNIILNLGGTRRSDNPRFTPRAAVRRNELFFSHGR